MQLSPNWFQTLLDDVTRQAVVEEVFRSVKVLSATSKSPALKKYRNISNKMYLNYPEVKVLTMQNSVGSLLLMY